MTTVTHAPTTCRSADDDGIGARILALAADVEGYVHRRLRTAGTTAGMRDELGDPTSITSDVVGEVVEILWTKRDQWVALPAEDQRCWTFGIARNLVARRIEAARLAHVRRREIVPLLHDDEEAAPVDPRLTGLAELRLLIESRLGDAAWETIAAAIIRNHSPRLRADVAAALKVMGAGHVPSLRAIVRRCRVDWRPWATDRLDAGLRLVPADAVDLGLFATLVEATSTLATWWAEQRGAFNLPTDVEALAASGLVDHLGRTELARREAATDLLVWIRRAHCETSQAA